MIKKMLHNVLIGFVSFNQIIKCIFYFIEGFCKKK